MTISEVLLHNKGCEQIALPVKPATSFYKEQSCLQDVTKTNLDNLDEIEKHFKLSIHVYQPTEQVWQLTQQPAHYPNTMTIGMFKQHAFYIKDIKKVAGLYLCIYCSKSFTQACHLQRHADWCTQGLTKIVYHVTSLTNYSRPMRKRYTPKQTRAKLPLIGSSTKVNYAVSTSTTRCQHPPRSLRSRWRDLDRRCSRRRNSLSNRISIARLLLARCPTHQPHEGLYEQTVARDQAIRDAAFDLVVMRQCEIPQAAKHFPIQEPKRIHILSRTTSKPILTRGSPLTHKVPNPRDRKDAHLGWSQAHQIVSKYCGIRCQCLISFVNG